jgi:hypothetical protein
MSIGKLASSRTDVSVTRISRQPASSAYQLARS